jgi:hypothetical protein
MADINKLRELSRPRYAKEEEYYNEIIKNIEEKMLEVAPHNDKVRVVFMRPGYAYGNTCSSGPDNTVYIDADRFSRFGKYLCRISAKYKSEGFEVYDNTDCSILTICWGE